jgi:hypothetical protein
MIGGILTKSLIIPALLFGATGSAQTVPVMVTRDPGVSDASFNAIKTRAGVVKSTSLDSVRGEQWEVPAAAVATLLSRLSGNGKKVSADYSGTDYRALFIPVAGADLTPTQSSALAAVSAQPANSEVEVVRLRAAPITAQMLQKGFGASDGLAPGNSVVLNLASRKRLMLSRKSLVQSSGGASLWSGTAAALADTLPDPAADPAALIAAGDARLHVNGDRIYGTVDVGADRYTITPLSGGMHAIAKVDYSKLPAEHPPLPPADPAPPPSAAGDVLPLPKGPATVAVAVGYTAAAEAQMRAQFIEPAVLVQDAIDEANRSFENSGISSRISLAGLKRIDGAETGDYDSLVAAVVDPADKRFDSIHPWRKSVKANATLMLVALDSYCGMASGIHVPAAKTFATVNWNCARINLSLPHEFGHLLGAQHDLDTEASNGWEQYARGYRYKAEWRTIMAYPGGSCGNCPRLPYWANPKIMHNGIPMGNPLSANDARAMEEMLPLYATYFAP